VATAEDVAVPHEELYYLNWQCSAGDGAEKVPQSMKVGLAAILVSLLDPGPPQVSIERSRHGDSWKDSLRLPLSIANSFKQLCALGQHRDYLVPFALRDFWPESPLRPIPEHEVPRLEKAQFFSPEAG
jgi:hypothetical protein